jgi:hypothetical protein
MSDTQSKLHRMSIDYLVIPHNRQNYETVGDYWWQGETLYIRVSKMSKPEYEQLVYMHELVEAIAVKAKGKIDESTKFDTPYEEARATGQPRTPCGCPWGEPGDDPHCPYYDEHQMATAVEIMFAKELGVNWTAYSHEAEALTLNLGLGPK